VSPPSDGIRIVRAAAGDREEVLTLVERLLEELEDRPEEFAGLDRARMLREVEAAGQSFAAFLARTPGGEPVGAVTVVETLAIYAGGRYGVIDEMYVAPEYRSVGVGRRLIEAAKELGRRRGWVRIEVTAPPEKKWERTVKFYERQGFVFAGPKLRCRLS
jgi:GNAT superfamily N-acetyltransferase